MCMKLFPENLNPDSYPCLKKLCICGAKGAQ